MAAPLLYGSPAPGVVDVPAGAVQVSPLIPGSARIEDIGDASLTAATVLAPPGVLERGYVLAQALRTLAPGGRLTALAPKDKGGSRLRKGLEALGCTVIEEARRHHRICLAAPPRDRAALETAIAKGAPREVADLGLWSQPGVFSWDRIDPGSALLLRHLPELAGQGADLGCGAGLLARRVLAMPGVKRLTLIDIDRRAIEAARRNVTDPRAQILWADVRGSGLEGLDFVVMNPPFHDGGAEDRALGAAFIRRAAAALRKGGTCWLVANRHLPYETVLGEAFARVELRAEAGGYKVYEARR